MKINKNVKVSRTLLAQLNKGSKGKGKSKSKTVAAKAVAPKVKVVKAIKTVGVAGSTLSTVKKTGFSRFEVERMVSVLGVDAHLCWLGSEINDSYLSKLRESASVLNSASLSKAKETHLIVNGFLFGFAWKIKANGDVYERSIGKTTVRGSLALLRGAYGKDMSTGTIEDVKKFANAHKMHVSCKGLVG